MFKSGVYMLFMGFAVLCISASCRAAEKHLPGVPYYYAEFSGYHIPPHPSKPLTSEEAVKRDAYYIAYYDERERLLSFTKYLYKKLFFIEKFFYRPDGTLERRESIDENGETKVYYYDENGKLVK